MLAVKKFSVMLYCVWINEWNWRKSVMYVSLNTYKNVYACIVDIRIVQYQMDCVCMRTVQFTHYRCTLACSLTRSLNVVHSWSLPKLKFAIKTSNVVYVNDINAIWHRTMPTYRNEERVSERERQHRKSNSSTNINLKFEIDVGSAKER